MNERWSWTIFYHNGHIEKYDYEEPKTYLAAHEIVKLRNNKDPFKGWFETPDFAVGIQSDGKRENVLVVHKTQLRKGI